ncbi:MAG: ABC transporter permease [Phycisphaerales bacterium]|nr:ABC transporter permease [Phycisphaerales bacterium]
MYQALLTNRYLTSRVIPLLAVAAVALCVALVIVVVSVMTGFLDMVRDSGRKLMGDVVISHSIHGIPYYEELIEQLVQTDDVAAATPVVDSWGLIKMPYPNGDSKTTRTVQIWGVDPDTFEQVTDFSKSIQWKTVEPGSQAWYYLLEDLFAQQWESIIASLDLEQRVALLCILKEDPQLRNASPEEIHAIASNLSLDNWRVILRSASRTPTLAQECLGSELWESILARDPRLVSADAVVTDGLSLSRDGGATPGIVMGLHVSEANNRTADGTTLPAEDWYWWMPRFEVTLTTMPIDQSGGIVTEPSSRILAVANEFQSGVYLIDDTRVLIPLDIAQDLLNLNQATIVDEFDPDIEVGIDPAKTTMILIRATDGVTPESLKQRASLIYASFYNDIVARPNTLVPPPSPNSPSLNIMTWEEQQAGFIGPVENERRLIQTLFSIVYVVCAALVLAIFWAIVYEKTRDIGILRSVGASRTGIIWIFLRYGLVVGSVGAVVGLGLGWLIVANINKIHGSLEEPPLILAWIFFALAACSVGFTIYLSWRGSLLPLVLGLIITILLTILAIGVLILDSMGGVAIWDPSIYYFSEIPSKLDWWSAIGTMIGAVIFSLIGAIIPAAKAADTDPVKALRYE